MNQRQIMESALWSPDKPLEVDPLAGNPDAWLGAVLLSDQIEYYTKELDIPLVANPNGF